MNLKQILPLLIHTVCRISVNTTHMINNKVIPPSPHVQTPLFAYPLFSLLCFTNCPLWRQHVAGATRLTPLFWISFYDSPHSTLLFRLPFFNSPFSTTIFQLPFFDSIFLIPVFLLSFTDSSFPTSYFRLPFSDSLLLDFNFQKSIFRSHFTDFSFPTLLFRLPFFDSLFRFPFPTPLSPSPTILFLSCLSPVCLIFVIHPFHSLLPPFSFLHPPLPSLHFTRLYPHSKFLESTATSSVTKTAINNVGICVEIIQVN